MGELFYVFIGRGDGRWEVHTELAADAGEARSRSALSLQNDGFTRWQGKVEIAAIPVDDWLARTYQIDADGIAEVGE